MNGWSILGWLSIIFCGGELVSTEEKKFNMQSCVNATVKTFN